MGQEMVSKSKAEILAAMRQEAEQRAAQDVRGSFPAYMRVSDRKAKSGKGVEGVVTIVRPEVKDANGNNTEQHSQSVRAVLMEEIAFSEFKYRKPDKSWATEAFALGTRRQAMSVGRLHNGAMPRLQVDELIGDGQINPEREVLTYDGDVKREAVRYGTRHACVFLLAPEHWLNEDEPELVMAFLSPSSVYGTSIEPDKEPDPEMRSEMRAATLSAFPTRGEEHELPDGTKREGRGILAELGSREWELGGGSATPMTAVWLNLWGEWLGTPRPVMAFEILEELTFEEIERVQEVKAQARELMVSWAARSYTQALPQLDMARARELANYALNGDMESVNRTAITALPEVVRGEPVEEAAPAAAERRGDDFDDEFPEDNLPF